MAQRHNGLSADMEALLYAHDHELLSDGLGETIELLYEHGVECDFVRDALFQRVQRHRVSAAFHPFSGSPRVRGGFVQGFDLRTGSRISYDWKLRMRNTLTVAGTGAGKSVLGRTDCLSVLHHSKLVEAAAGNRLLADRVWMWDLYKNEYSSLYEATQKMGVSLNIVPVEQIRFNPLMPPTGVPATAYNSNLTDILINVLELGPSTERALFSVLESLSREFANRDTYPTLFDLRERIRVSTHIHAQSKQSILTRLDPLLIRLGNAVAWRRSWPIEDLARCNIVWGISQLQSIDQCFLTSCLMLSLFQCALHGNRMNCDRGKVFVVIDEAGRMLRGKNNPIAHFLRICRGSSVVVDLYTQFLGTEVGHSVLANCPNQRLGMVNLNDDLREMGTRVMNLNPQQIRFLQKTLKGPGIFASHVAGLAQPFLFTIPLLKDPEHPVPTHVCPDLDKLSSLTEPADEFMNWSPEWVSAISAVSYEESLQREELKSSSNVAATGANAHLLTDAERRIWRVVANYPSGISLTHVRREAQIKNQVATNAKVTLIEKSMIIEQKVQKSRGRPTALLFPTDQA